MKEGLTGDYELPTWAAVFILAAGLLLLGGYEIYKDYRAYQSKQTEVLQTQEEELAVLKQEVESLKGGTTSSKKAEDILAAAPGSTLANVVREWRPRVASIECRWEGLFGDAVDHGSGLWISNDNTVITADHVVTAEGVELGPPVKADSCLVKLPGSEAVAVGPGDISDWRGVEGVAAIKIKNPTTRMKQVVSSLNSVCKNEAPSGERIVVVGYPTIGAKNDVTVTEGIISGKEDDFYVTSAKIERGVSGGVTVWADKSCYLGMPTFARAGEVESLGRVLDSGLFIK